jgi:putative MATE family efflux protein
MMMLGIGDTFMLGGYSDYAVGAVGVVNQILNMVFLLFSVVTTGTSVLCARYLGAQDKLSMKSIVSVSIIFNVLFGLAISLGLYIFSNNILDMMDLREELMDDAIIYMKYVGGFAVLQAISLTLSAILRALQRPKFPMIAIIVINVVNLIGNYSLIYGHFGFSSMGVEGAAIATVISRSVSVIILSIALFGFVLKDFSKRDIIPFNWNKLKEIFDIGLPSAGELLSYSLSQVVVTYLINAVSKEALITRTYVSNIVMVTYLLAFAVAEGNSIFVGYLIGDKRHNAAHKTTIYALKITIIVSVILSTIIGFVGKDIVALLTENKEIIILTTIVVWIDLLLEVGRALNMIVIQALRATGDYIFPVAFGAFSMWLIAVGCSYLFGFTFGWGLIGIWIAFTLDENIRGWAMLRRWNNKKWQIKK